MKSLLTTIIALGLSLSLVRAETVETTEERTNLRLGFQRIVAGTFTMGSPLEQEDRDKDEGPVSVEIGKSFDIMRREMTQKQWVEVMGSNPSFFSTNKHCNNHVVKNGVGMCPSHPVESVSWHEVQQFIVQLNQRDGNTNCDGTPQSAKGCYRLPTEAEWEYAGRADTDTRYFFGGSDEVKKLKEYSWYAIEGTEKVGRKEKNPWGLYDMYGNVMEWVQDAYAVDLLGGIDPLQEIGAVRVVRGGSWKGDGFYLQSARRAFESPVDWYNYIGFRLVRTRAK